MQASDGAGADVVRSKELSVMNSVTQARRAAWDFRGLDRGRLTKETSKVIRRLTWMVAVTVLAGSAAWAQDPRVEISGTAGWTFSDGVGGETAVSVPGVGVFDSIGPKDAFSWGARLGFNVTPNVEVGFLFNQQSTKYARGGTTNVDLADVSVYNYHGYFAYNFGDSDATVRPYVLGGLGATPFGSGAATPRG